MLRYMIYADDHKISFKKPVMILIHGLGGGYANWHGQVHALKKEYDLLLIELPSHGNSPVMMSEMEISYEALTEKLFEVVDHLGIKKATYAGVSLGTMLVKYIVLNHPERVDKYILAGPIGDFTLMLRSAINMVKYLLPVSPLNFILGLVAAIVMPYKVSKFGRDIFLACARRLPKKEFIAWCKLLTKFKSIQKKYQATMKTEPNGLYLVGALDHFFIPMLKRDRKRVKNMIFVENAGHICIADQADIVNQYIIEFCNTGAVKPLTV